MSNIIKFAHVVDDGSNETLYPFDPSMDLPVIKRRAAGKNPADAARALPLKDAFTDELNRILVQVEDAKRELRRLNLEVKEESEAVEALKAERAELEKFEGLSVDAEVAKLIQQAEKEAEEIRKKAYDENVDYIESLKSQGYLDGLEQGANEARHQVREENQPGVEALSHMIEELSGLRDQLMTEHEDEILSLVMLVAEKVIGREIREDPKAVVDMLREVMEQNRREEYIKIIISKDLMPVQAKACEQVKKTIQTLGQQVDVYVESEGRPGGILIETSGGFTDMGVATQLGNISEALAETHFDR